MGVIREIQVHCTEEGVVVGVLQLPIGSTRLTAREVWDKFVPETQERRLSGVPMSDGKYLQCPRCMGKLAINGQFDVKDPAEALGTIGGSKTAAKDLMSKVKPMNDAMIPIVLGSTRLDIS